MAAVKLAPASGKVTGTHNNIPLLVIPSAIANIGTLTTAEANSVRFYVDSEYVVEIPRQVVNANEIHYKSGASFSSSTDTWMDWDGIRADYAATDTYGRNAVWSDYESVLHLSESSGDAIDSAGKGDFTSTNVTYNVTGQIGDGYNIGSVKYLTRANLGMVVNNTKNVTLQGWTKVSTGASLGSPAGFISLASGSLSSTWNMYLGANPDNLEVFTRQSGLSVRATSSVNAKSGNMDMLHGIRSYTTLTQRVYKNGTQIASASLATSASPENTTPAIIVGYFRVFSDVWVGDIDEIRIRLSELSADWIATEYQNQNNNGAFWVATPINTGTVKLGFWFWYL
jgi:ribonuclease HI